MHQREVIGQVEAAMMVYVSPDSKDFFLSKESMIQLGVIKPDLPCIRKAGGAWIGQGRGDPRSRMWMP